LKVGTTLLVPSSFHDGSTQHRLRLGLEYSRYKQVWNSRGTQTELSCCWIVGLKKDEAIALAGSSIRSSIIFERVDNNKREACQVL